MVAPAWFGLIDFKVLLFEKPAGTPKVRGKQVDQTALCARATRGLSRPSLDARSEGQSGHPALGKGQEWGQLLCWP